MENSVNAIYIFYLIDESAGMSCFPTNRLYWAQALVIVGLSVSSSCKHSGHWASNKMLTVDMPERCFLFNKIQALVFFLLSKSLNSKLTVPKCGSRIIGSPGRILCFCKNTT